MPPPDTPPMCTFHIPYEDPVIQLCAQKPVCMRTNWARSWRLHVRTTREAFQRVRDFGSSDLASRNTDLNFCIRHFSVEFDEMLDRAAWVY